MPGTNFRGAEASPPGTIDGGKENSYYGYMKKAKIAELKNNLSRYLEHVRGGGTVVVFDRDQPVARIVPLPHGPRDGGGGAERLARLERRGMIRRGTGGLPQWLGRRRPPRLRGSVLRDLLREREKGW